MNIFQGKVPFRQPLNGQIKMYWLGSAFNEVNEVVRKQEKETKVNSVLLKNMSGKISTKNLN